MPRLIVLNGPPAVGKSSLARRYLDEHPLALMLELDSVRHLLGRWAEEPTRAGLLAREMTLVMARTHLANGYDVVLPQYLGNPVFLAQAEQVATDTGVPFHEFVLMDDRDTVVHRFAERTRAATRPSHVDAGRLVASLGGQDTLFALYDRLLLVLSARPHARVVQCPAGSFDDVYAEIVRSIGTDN